MDLRQLKYFASIYEAGTLARASEKLLIATSALSHHLARLEAEFSTTLFTRTSKGVEPTASGHRMYKHAKNVLKAASEASLDMGNLHGSISGDMTVGLPNTAIPAVAVQLIKMVRAKHPEMRLRLTEALSGDLVESVKSGNIDIALVFNPKADDFIRATPLLEERMICVGKTEVIGNTDAPIEFDEMINLPALILWQGQSTRALMDDPTRLRKLEASNVFQINSHRAINLALKEGLGFAIGTQFFSRRYLKRGMFHAREIVNPEITRNLCIVERKGALATSAKEWMYGQLVGMVKHAVQSGDWDARLI